MKERRVTNRFGCSHLVHYKDETDGSIGMVVDLSLDGARLRSQTPLASGKQVLLQSLDTNGAAPIWCEVRWYDAGEREAGLQFSDPVGEVLRSWVGEVLEGHQSHLIQRRESVRVSARMPVVIREGGSTSEGLLVDISSEGALLRCPTLWSTGTVLDLSLALGRKLRVQAEIIGGRCHDDGWEYSLRLVELKAAARKALDSYITSVVLN